MTGVSLSGPAVFGGYPVRPGNRSGYRSKRLVGMEDLVEEEATSEDAQASKPAPDIFAAALKKAGVGAEEAIALGDTP
jgi:FMN phosphatase YigB (HAD superfamily)